MNPIGCTVFVYTKDQVQSLAATFKLNRFRFEPALSWGLEVFKTEDAWQILRIANLIDKIKSVVDGKSEFDEDFTNWVQEALSK